MSQSLVEIWRQIIIGDTKLWALFQNGTCVVLMKPERDLVGQAIELLKVWGPVHAGSSAGDFSIIHLEDNPVWVVTGHHPDILTFVWPEEVEDGNASDLFIGLIGRTKRDQDAQELQLLHIEDKRPVT